MLLEGKWPAGCYLSGQSMSQSPAVILLIEDISTVQFFVRNALAALSKPYKLLTACSLADARAIIVDVAIDLFIVDIGLPDGDGIEFLCEAAMLHPEATAIVITATPSDANRERAEQLGIVEMISKPINRDHLVNAVVRMLRWDAQAPPVQPSFRATLSGLTPMDIVQLKCISSATGVIEFSNACGTGRVYFERGDVIHATVAHPEGDRKVGFEAFEEIVSWKSGHIADVPDADAPPHTIRKNWQSLLLEVAQSRDEGAHAAA
jgi:CheY-like chemotaxis protein